VLVVRSKVLLHGRHRDILRTSGEVANSSIRDHDFEVLYSMLGFQGGDCAPGGMLQSSLGRMRRVVGARGRVVRKAKVGWVGLLTQAMRV